MRVLLPWYHYQLVLNPAGVTDALCFATRNWNITHWYKYAVSWLWMAQRVSVFFRCHIGSHLCRCQFLPSLRFNRWRQQAGETPISSPGLVKLIVHACPHTCMQTQMDSYLYCVHHHIWGLTGFLLSWECNKLTLANLHDRSTGISVGLLPCVCFLFLFSDNKITSFVTSALILWVAVFTHTTVFSLSGHFFCLFTVGKPCLQTVGERSACNHYHSAIRERKHPGLSVF